VARIAPTVTDMAHPCDLVIPCRDEAAALPSALSDLPEGVRAIVVDNGSKDATAAVARALGAQVVDEPVPGYGAAVHAGVCAATAAIVAVMDGDGSVSAADLVRLVDDVAEGRADLAVGRRRAVERGAWPWHARAGNAVLSGRLRRRAGLDVHDIAPMRVCGRQPLLDLDVQDRRSGYPLELLLRAGAAGWTVAEHDIRYYRRAEGTRSKVSGSLVGTVHAVRDFAKVMR
jgi:glycosyltransferase involved in cell wall biosynthesis